MEETEAKIQELNKRKEELTKMAKEKAKLVFKRNTIPLRPTLYRQATPPTDQANEPGPSNLNMPFQRGMSADFDLYCPSQDMMSRHFPPPPADSNYGHFIPPNSTYPPTFDPFQSASLTHQLPSHNVVSQSSQQFPAAAATTVDYTEDNQYWDVVDGQYGPSDWSQHYYP
jgi:hypothetical protein